ncbi:MAG: OmpA family protein [Myxococcales bacterium]|nr:OmpA family protein [Myxococcales bacterium]
MSSSSCIRSTLAALALLGASPGVAQAQQTPLGFQVSRYEPTAAGEWSFWVDHPWYSSTRRFAGGLTLNYAHNQLTQARQNTNGSVMNTGAIQAHFLSLHLDLAVSFFDRLNITASLPVQLLSQGEGLPAGSLQATGLGFADPRFGLMFRIFGQPDASPISLSVAAHAWIPLNDGANGAFNTRNDTQFRFLPKLILAGYGSRIRWSFTGGFLYRPEARLVANNFVAGTAGSELQLGASIYYADKERRFAIGPEAVLGTLLIPNQAFQQNATSVEVLAGFHYNIANLIQLGGAGGIGLLREPGTPDARALLRIAYAPLPPIIKDRDKDGVQDHEDLCPDVQAGLQPDPEKKGCPLTDIDMDGVWDNQDLCPKTAAGDHPDPARKGCPAQDSDSDGVFDYEDQCVDKPAGKNPDPEKKGCPLKDRDEDGVFDNEDQCLDTPAGEHPDPRRKGCPATDKDGDGVWDHEDQCLEIPAGVKPDPAKRGCPLPDTDGDTVVDPEDACPDKPGAPSPDPKKNGCPGLVEIKNGLITIKQQIFFATNKDTILPKSFPVLKAVADVLKVQPFVKKVGIEGHTDNKGKPDKNLDLSKRRAASVLKHLVAKEGIEEKRLESQGYGDTRPIADNKNEKGRALNRRVDFRIVDPPQPQSAAPAPTAAPTQAPSAAQTAPATQNKATDAGKKPAGKTEEAAGKQDAKADKKDAKADKKDAKADKKGAKADKKAGKKKAAK